MRMHISKNLALAGAAASVADFPGPCWRRLQGDVALQWVFTHLCDCGARPVAEAVVELLDMHGVQPDSLDRLFEWHRLDAKLCAAIGADGFPPPPLAEVPE
jgi:hypothetical protein